MPGVFDLHAHVVLEEAFGAAGAYGPFHGDDEKGREYFRVGTYEVKPIPPTLFGRIEAEPAIDFARAINEARGPLRPDA